MIFRSAFLLFIGLFAIGAQAAIPAIEIEPVIGYERTQRFVPDPHFHDGLMYGLRASVGIPRLSAEAEYTRGIDNETFPEQGLSTTDTDDMLKVGLRSAWSLGNLVSAFGRGGVQAKHENHQETSGNVTTVLIQPIAYKPYAGVGISGNLSGKVSIDGCVTAVFNDFPQMSQNDYQTTLGLTVRLP
jgi:hypothetical protein